MVRGRREGKRREGGESERESEGRKGEEGDGDGWVRGRRKEEGGRERRGGGARTQPHMDTLSALRQRHEPAAPAEAHADAGGAGGAGGVEGHVDVVAYHVRPAGLGEGLKIIYIYI